MLEALSTMLPEEEQTWRFFVPGLPRPGGSKRGFVHRQTGRVMVTEDCKASKDWRTAVAFAASARVPAPVAGALELVVTFRLPRPSGHYGSGKNALRLRASAPPYPIVKPDLTKLLRSTEDALKGIAWFDDAQIVNQWVRKEYAERGTAPGAEITIRLTARPSQQEGITDAG